MHKLELLDRRLARRHTQQLVEHPGTLEQLIAKYPQSEAAGKARQRLAIR